MRARRGFSLTELLVVVSILAILAALLFPVYTQAKERAKLADCQSRLHQVSLALNLYRADNDGQAWLKYSDSSSGYTTAGRFRYPWNDWLPVQHYLKNGQLVWCPVPNRNDDQTSIHNLTHLRVINRPQMATEKTVTVWHAFNPEPGTVVAFCANHTRNEILHPLPMGSSGTDLLKGKYLFVREDGSAGAAEGSALTPWYLQTDGKWTLEPGTGLTSQAWHFPGEPWPPSLPPL